MAVSRITSYVDDTETSASAVAAVLKTVEVEVDPSSVTEVYVQLFNVADPDPGTTAPNMVLAIPPVGRDNRRKRKFVFAGGMVFNTALTYIVTTTHDGQTVPTGADAPEYVAVYYEPLDS